MSLLVKGATELLKLTDTPNSYAGQAGMVLAVNGAEDGTEFIDPPEQATYSFGSVEAEGFTPSPEEQWDELDLSRAVPEGATGAIFHLVNRDPGQELHTGLRMRGSTLSHAGSMKRSSHTWAIVGLDENRKCEALQENIGWQDFLLVGYVGRNFCFFADGYNLRPAVHSSWVTVDLSPYVPAGAGGVILEVFNYHDYGVTAGVRMHGSTDDRRRACYHSWAIVGCDASRRIDVYFVPQGAGGGQYSGIQLIGYITGGVDFFTDAPEITPTQDGAYHTIGLLGYKANPILAIIELDSLTSTEDWALRKNSWAYDVYRDGTSHTFALVHPNTPDSTLQGKLEGSNQHLYLLGIA